MIASAGLERDVLIVACAISAGIHSALTPSHFAERIESGLGFAAAAVVLAALSVRLTHWSVRPVSVAGAGAVLAGLIASYALATTTGLPLLHSDPEPVDGLALATKVVEAAGLFAAVHLLWRGLPVVAVTHLRTEGRLT